MPVHLQRNCSAVHLSPLSVPLHGTPPPSSMLGMISYHQRKKQRHVIKLVTNTSKPTLVRSQPDLRHALLSTLLPLPFQSHDKGGRKPPTLPNSTISRLLFSFTKERTAVGRRTSKRYGVAGSRHACGCLHEYEQHQRAAAGDEDG